MSTRRRKLQTPRSSAQFLIASALFLFWWAAPHVAHAGKEEGVPVSWRGLVEVGTDEFYTDASRLPEQAPGMPFELRRLINNAEGYHRRTMIAPELQDMEDKMTNDREEKLPEQLIPRKIWQRCELPPPRLKRAYAKTWSNVNPEYVHTVCDEKQAEEMVKQDYPALLDIYKCLEDPQARIDFWSYLVLFKYGGVFASIDSTCERPLRNLLEEKDDFFVGMQPKLVSTVLAKQVGLQHHSWPLRECPFTLAGQFESYHY
jgi:mannosyltransferase OCH1-like enzyme